MKKPGTNDALSGIPPFEREMKAGEGLKENVFDWNKWVQVFYLGAALALGMIGLFWGQNP